MKENWMDKLIELLNKYEKERKSWYTWNNIDSYDNCVYWVDCDWETEITMYSDLYSKYYWFIKWLVDKDKIDFDNRELKDEFMVEFERYPTFHGNTYNRDFNENGLLMLLAIQDDPISFLISVLR